MLQIKYFMSTNHIDCAIKSLFCISIIASGWDDIVCNCPRIGKFNGVYDERADYTSFDSLYIFIFSLIVLFLHLSFKSDSNKIILPITELSSLSASGAICSLVILFVSKSPLKPASFSIISRIARTFSAFLLPE